MGGSVVVIGEEEDLQAAIRELSLGGQTVYTKVDPLRTGFLRCSGCDIRSPEVEAPESECLAAAARAAGFKQRPDAQEQRDLGYYCRKCLKRLTKGQ